MKHAQILRKYIQDETPFGGQVIEGSEQLTVRLLLDTLGNNSMSRSIAIQDLDVWFDSFVRDLFGTYTLQLMARYYEGVRSQQVTTPQPSPGIHTQQTVVGISSQDAIRTVAHVETTTVVVPQYDTVVVPQNEATQPIRRPHTPDGEDR